MPGKSRHGKGKRSTQGKRRKSQQQFSATVAQQTAGAQTHEPPRPTVSAPSASMPTPTAKPAAIKHPYIATELRTIGIMAGIMLIILAVLAIVLR